MYYINLICSRITNRMNNIFHAVIFRVCVLCVCMRALRHIHCAPTNIIYTRVLHHTKIV